jgi:copper chaperone
MVTFQVADMTCGRCAQALGAALTKVEGSAEVVIDIGRKLVQVNGEAPTAALADAIRRAGYTPVEVSGAPAKSAAPASGGCCGGRAAASVDLGQSPRAASGSCCG